MPFSYFSREDLSGAAYRADKQYRLDRARYRRYSEHDSSKPLVGCNSVVRNIPSIFHLAVKFQKDFSFSEDACLTCFWPRAFELRL